MKILLTISSEEAKLLKNISQPGESLDTVAKRLFKQKITKLKKYSFLTQGFRQ